MLFVSILFVKSSSSSISSYKLPCDFSFGVLCVCVFCFLLFLIVNDGGGLEAAPCIH